VFNEGAELREEVLLVERQEKSDSVLLLHVVVDLFAALDEVEGLLSDLAHLDLVVLQILFRRVLFPWTHDQLVAFPELLFDIVGSAHGQQLASAHDAYPVCQTVSFV
jgi:hypothetical protein